MRGRVLAAVMAAAAALAVPPTARAQEAKAGATVADYYAELERLGLVDRNTGTPEALAAELGRAEATLEAGDPVGASVMLYAIVESPRFTDFSDFPDYQNAEYDLAVALFASGAYESALGYLERILARGPTGLYFAAAHRRAVDIGLETRTYAAILSRVEAIKSNDPLPAEATGERAYLRARQGYDEGKLAEAEGELARISRRSRLYSSSLYLRGVIMAKKGELGDASDAFCEIVDTPDTDRYTFYVDNRYFTVKDLARLGLGRIAHEEQRYDDAYYHYFQIPDDSDRLAEALFEAAWSMYQKRELSTARDLAAELVKTFPDSPMVPESLLLAGYVELADCKFEEAQKKFDVVVKELAPVLAAARTIARSREARQSLMARALERERLKKKDPEAAAALRGKATTAEQRVLSMLRVDPQIVRLNDAATGLRREARSTPQVIAAWRQLAARMGRAGVAAVAQEIPEEIDARAVAELDGDIRQLGEEVRREREEVEEAARAGTIPEAAAADRKAELAEAAQKLEALGRRVVGSSEDADARLAARADPRLRDLVEADLDATRALADRTRAFSERFDAEAEKLTASALDGQIKDLRRILDKAKLGKVDSVIGQKRRLEIEVEDLAQGRYPAELINKLWSQGLIGDDEEYWPPEEEYWKDEYEGYR